MTTAPTKRQSRKQREKMSAAGIQRRTDLQQGIPQFGATVKQGGQGEVLTRMIKAVEAGLHGRKPHSWGYVSLCELLEGKGFPTIMEEHIVGWERTKCDRDFQTERMAALKAHKDKTPEQLKLAVDAEILANRAVSKRLRGWVKAGDFVRLAKMFRELASMVSGTHPLGWQSPKAWIAEVEGLENGCSIETLVNWLVNRRVTNNQAARSR